MQVALDNNIRRKLIIIDEENKKAYSLEFPHDAVLEDLLNVSKELQANIEKAIEEEKNKDEESPKE